MFYFYYSRQTLNSKSTKFKSFSEDKTEHDQVNYSSAVSETRQLINSFHTSVVRAKGISTSALQVNNPSRVKLRFQVIN